MTPHLAPAPPRATLHVVALLGLLLAFAATPVRAQARHSSNSGNSGLRAAVAPGPASRGVRVHAAAPRFLAGAAPRISAVRVAPGALRWSAAGGRADARPPRAGVLDPLGSVARREHPGARHRDVELREQLLLDWNGGWDPDALLAALEPPEADADASLEPEAPRRRALRLPRDVVRCLEPALHRRRADAHPRLLLDPEDAPASGTTWSVREEIHAPGSKALRGVYQVRLLDVRIAGQDLALHWSAGSSVDGVRPISGSPVSTDTTGGTEIIELSFGDPGGGSLSSFVRGRRQPEDAYASAFGRGIQGTAGVQYSPGGRWDWRLQAQQQFVNQVTEPIQAMEFSLWARLRF